MGFVTMPVYRAYVNGKLTLAGVDESRVSAARWLDAVYAIMAESPPELEKMHNKVTVEGARIAPDRDTWGLLPDQVALSQGLTQGARANRVGRSPARGPKTR